MGDEGAVAATVLSLDLGQGDDFIDDAGATFNNSLTIAGAATMHHCHTPEIELTSPVTATGIWAMEDLLVFPDGSRLHGAGHYHEEYEKREGRWQITRLHLTRTLMDFTAAGKDRG